MQPTSVSADGATLVETFEGTYTRAYRDPIGIWTICTGHTPSYAGETKTAAQCRQILTADLTKFCQGVLRLVKVPLTQHQLDALTSFAFNVGLGAFGSSTLLKKLNARDYDGACAELDRWVYAGGRVFLGLQRRRDAEQALFLDGHNTTRLAEIPKLTPAQARLVGFSEKATTASALTQAADRLKAQIERTKDVKRRSPKTDQEAFDRRLEILRRERSQALDKLEDAHV